MEEKNIEEKEILEEIQNLGPFFVDDLDMTTAVISKIKQVIQYISVKEQMSFIETYRKVKLSPVFSLLTDDYIEAFYTDIDDIYNSFKNLEERKRK